MWVAVPCRWAVVVVARVTLRRRSTSCCRDHLQQHGHRWANEDNAQAGAEAKPWLKVLHGICALDARASAGVRRAATARARRRCAHSPARWRAYYVYRDHLKHKARQHDAIRAAPS